MQRSMESSTRPGIARVTTRANINTDPASYGCLPLGEYLWFNNGHLTSRVHEIRGAEYEEVGLVVVVVEVLHVLVQSLTPAEILGTCLEPSFSIPYG